MTTVNNLNQFKTFLTVNIGLEVLLTNHIRPERSRMTKVIHSQSNSFALETNGTKKDSKNIYDHSWTDFGKANSWKFEIIDSNSFNATKIQGIEQVFTLEFREVA